MNNTILHSISALSLAVLCGCAGGYGNGPTVWVDAHAGADGDGTRARPFVSCDAAVAYARTLPRDNGPVTIRLASGDYIMAGTLDARDSDLRIVGGKSVRFTRAVRTKPGAVVRCDVPPPPDHESFFEMKPQPPLFFYDGKWATEARYPNEGWLAFKKKDVVDSGIRSRNISGILPDGKPQAGAFVFPDDRPARWNFEDGIRFCGYPTHDWSFERIRFASYTTSNRVMRLAAGATYGIGCDSWSEHDGRRFYVSGARAELDAPGEYFYDRKTGRVDFIAPEGMKEFLVAGDDKPIVSVKHARNIVLEGLTFEYGGGDGVWILGCTDVVVRACAVFNVGGTGVIIRDGARCRVEKTEIAHVGFKGVHAEGGDRRTLTRGDHVVADCTIHDFSRIGRTYSPGVRMLGCGNALRGSRIYDAPHSAVIYLGNDLLFENNEVWNVLWECGDAGAFYTGRDPTSRGNVLRGNYVHDIGHPERGSTNTMAFYIDDCDAGDTVISNRVVNAPRGVMLGGGHDNHLIGNVFERCNLAISVDGRGIIWNEHWDSPTNPTWQMTRKVREMHVDEEPWKSHYPLLVNYLNDHPREPRHCSLTGNRFKDCKKTIEWAREIRDHLDWFVLADNVEE